MSQSTISFYAPVDNAYRRSANARQNPLSNIATANGDVSYSVLYTNVRELYVPPNGSSLVGATTSNGIIQAPMYGNSAGSVNVSLARSTFLSNVQHISRVGSFDFSSNGNLMYVMDDYTGIVSMTNLGASYNVATACTNSIYNRANSWLRVNTPNVAAVYSSPSGNNIYVMSSDYKLVQYSLAANSDLYAATNVASATQVSSWVMKDMSIGRDGGNLYVSYSIGSSLTFLSKYILPTPWSIGTISTQSTFDIPMANANILETSHYISPTGTNLFYYIKTANNVSRVYRRTMPTPWFPFSSVAADSFIVDANVVSTALGLEFSDDGTKMYLNGGNLVHTFNLANSWSLASGVTYDSNAVMQTKVNSRSLTFTDYGNNVIYANYDVTNRGNASIIHRETLSQSWNVASYTLSNTAPGTLFPRLGSDLPTSIAISTTGNTILVGAYGSSNYIKQYDMTDSWNLQSAVLSNTYVLPNNGQVGGMNSFTMIGDNVFYAIDSNNTAFSYNIASANANSLSFKSSYPFTGDRATTGLAVSSNNSFLFSTSKSNAAEVPTFRKHVMSEASNVASAAYISSYTLSYPVESELGNSSILGMFISNSGKKLFFQGTVFTYEYALDTAWDFSTIRYVKRANTQFKLGSGAIGLYFSPNGEYAFTYNTGSASVNICRMSKPWDISTFGSSTTQSFSLFSSRTVKKIIMSPNGRYFMLADTGGAVYTYTLSTAYDISTLTLSSNTGFTYTDIDVSPCGRYVMTLRDAGLGSKGFDTYRTLVAPWDFSTYTTVNGIALGITFPVDYVYYTPMGDTIIGFGLASGMLYKIRM